MPPAPSIPPLSPFAPLATGEAIVEAEAQIITVSLTLAGAISSVNETLLKDAMKAQLGCYAPCEIALTLSAGSINVQAQMIVPTSEASTAASVASSAQTFASSSTSDLTTALAPAGVTVASVSPTVAQTTQTVAIRVAPPPPSPPPSPSPPPPSLPPPSSPSSSSSDSDNTGAIIVGVVGGVFALLFCAALGYFIMKKQSKPKVVTAA